jgi:hypothetical protein
VLGLHDPASLAAQPAVQLPVLARYRSIMLELLQMHLLSPGMR